MRFPVLALVFLGLLALHASAAVSPIILSVDQVTAAKHPKTKPGQSPQSGIAQHRSLAIKLTNMSGEPMSGIVVKYFFIGHDLKDQKMKVLQHGERKASLSPGKTETVESEEVVNTYTEAHTEMAKGKSKGKSKGKPKAQKVAASGQKVTGYAVQVFNGTKLEVEEYSAEAFKPIVAASAPKVLSPAEEYAAAHKAAAKKSAKAK